MFLLFSPVFVWFCFAGRIFFPPDFFVKDVVETQISVAEIPGLQSFLKIGFESGEDLNHWQEHRFVGRTQYQIVTDENGGWILDALSQGTASGYIKSLKIKGEAKPRLSWEWRVQEFPSRDGDAMPVNKSEDDFSLRVYAIFQGALPWRRQVIQYVWDESIPEGYFQDSPHTGQVKMLVVESGRRDDAGWVREERDLTADYEKIFGKVPDCPLTAIGIMSDADNTQTRTHAQLKNLGIAWTA